MCMLKSIIELAVLFSGVLVHDLFCSCIFPAANLFPNPELQTVDVVRELIWYLFPVRGSHLDMVFQSTMSD